MRELTYELRSAEVSDYTLRGYAAVFEQACRIVATTSASRARPSMNP